MIKSNVRSHSIFRPIFAAIASLFAIGGVVQPAAAVTLSQTTQQMPSLAVFNGKLYLAWAGTDSSHHLNVASSTDGTTFGSPTVLNNTAASDTGPAIVAFNGLLYIAWQGGDGALNVISSSDGVNFGNQLLVSSYTSTCTPALAATSSTLYIAYCFNSNNNSGFNLASSVDGANWSASSIPSTEITNYTPALAIYGSDLVLAYAYPPTAGSEPQGAVYIWSTPATTLSESTAWTYNMTDGYSENGGPALAALNGFLYMAEFNPSQVPYLYTLQTASTGLIDLVTEQTIPGTVASATNPALAAFNGHLYFAWKGTDNPAHLNIVEVF